MTRKTLCACGSKQLYTACCGFYITGALTPKTAEALMRARYTAYTQANIDYIQATMRGRAAEGYNPIESKQWAQSVKWKGLKVYRAFADVTEPTRAYVQFVARYQMAGKIYEIAETSVFLLHEGAWYYVDQIPARNQAGG